MQWILRKPAILPSVIECSLYTIEPFSKQRWVAYLLWAKCMLVTRATQKGATQTLTSFQHLART